MLTEWGMGIDLKQNVEMWKKGEGNKEGEWAYWMGTKLLQKTGVVF